MWLRYYIVAPVANSGRFYLTRRGVLLWKSRKGAFILPKRLSYERLRSTEQQPQLEQVQHKLEHLAPERLAEVEDFIDFLQQRDQEKRLRRDYAQASEQSFARAWENDEDAVYDEL